MPPADHDVSHGDILLQIGQLQGQVQTLITLIGQKREDINACFNRLGALEKGSATREELTKQECNIGVIKEQMSRWAGAIMIVAFGLPILITVATASLKPELRLGAPTPAPHIPHSTVKP